MHTSPNTKLNSPLKTSTSYQLLVSGFVVCGALELPWRVADNEKYFGEDENVWQAEEKLNGL